MENRGDGKAQGSARRSTSCSANALHLTIGDGAVVGACAVVVSGVPPGVVVTGVPARAAKTI